MTNTASTEKNERKIRAISIRTKGEQRCCLQIECNAKNNFRSFRSLYDFNDSPNSCFTLVWTIETRAFTLWAQNYTR